MSQRFLKVIVTKQAYTSLNELVEVLRKEPVAGKHTDLIVTNMGVTSAAFNESYFLKPLIELDAFETKRIVSKMSSTQLITYASLIEGSLIAA